MNNKKLIFESLRKLALTTGTQVTQERYEIYTERLAVVMRDMDQQDLLIGLENLQVTCKWFPSLAEIIERLNPQEATKEDATLMAAEIIGAISTYGPYQFSEVKSMLGPIVWYAVERFGGWDQMCNLTYDDLGVARAQLRDICKVAMNLEKRNPRMLRSKIERNAKNRINELRPVSYNNLLE